MVLDKRLRNRSRPRSMFRVAEDRVVCSGAGVVFSTCWPRFKLNRDLLPNKVERLGVGSDEGGFVLDVEVVDEGLKWGVWGIVRIFSISVTNYGNFFQFS